MLIVLEPELTKLALDEDVMVSIYKDVDDRPLEPATSVLGEYYR